MLDKIKALGYHFSTIGAITVAASDMIVPPVKYDLLKEADETVEKIEKMYKRGFISDDERYEKVVEIWNNATDAVQGEEAPEQYAVDAEDTMAAKPMNCPNAMMSYKRTMHSYKELPIRYSEYDVLHRKEKSGQMNGLFRVQEFRQDDDHTFVTPEQIKDEIQRLKNERYRIQETINHLEDEREKRLLELRYIDGWSWVRVCTRLEISETWSRMLHRSACEHFAQAYDNLQDWRGMYER